jgi:glycerate 2-kinase
MPQLPSMPDLKDTARSIFHRTLEAMDIPAAIERQLSRSGTRIRAGDAWLDLAKFPRLRAVAVGKAGLATAEGLLRVLGSEFHLEGVLAVPAAPPRKLDGWQTFVCGHPVPDEESFRAARAILEMLEGCDENTLVFFLLSGGGSALVELPLFPEVTLAEVQALHRALVTCGAPIDEMNAVRKHFSAVKGGRLAAAAPGAMKLTLGVSDVPLGRESALGSGPTLPDPTTVADVCRIAEHFALAERLPAALRSRLAPGRLPETPKEGDPAFARAHFSLVLGMHQLFHQAHKTAEAAGCITICDNTTDDWPVEEAAAFLLGQLDALRSAHPERSVCVIADGEVSSPVTGGGIGGRNSAFVLACVEKISGRPIAVLSAGTDGIDGNSPAAGAVADGNTLARARALGLDPGDFFRRSDAYSFFRNLSDTVETGPTGNNLRDLRILVARPGRA